MYKNDIKQIDLDELDIIKHIGKGSFSNVYLCKNRTDSNLFFTDEILGPQPVFFIVKEININNLVKKYTKNSILTNKKYIKRRSGYDIEITPYENNIYNRASEFDYYFKRLQELIESEIDILNILDHKNIIKFYHWYKKNNIYYLFMEYCNKGDLYELLKKSSISKEQLLTQFIIQIIDSLYYLHQNNIIHRDIKLHNILLHNEDNGDLIFKLSDFGFACYDMSTLEGNSIDLEDSLCKKYFKLCGTPFYMAPEIILNMNKMENITKYKNTSNEFDIKEYTFYTKTIDIWSLGVCLYEFIFDDLPFDNIKNIKELEKFFKKENSQKIIDSKISECKTINSKIKNLLLSMLSIKKNNRKDINFLKEYVDKHFKNNYGILTKNSEEMMFLEEILSNKNNFDDNKIDGNNENLKNHIIKTPENINYEERGGESWEKINDSESIINNINWENRFLNWLTKKF